MRRVLCLLLLLAVTACTDDPAPRATSTPTATPTATGTTDPFEAIAPPTSPGVGQFEAILANRAYAATQGYLALQLLEPATLTGANDAELVSQLQGAVRDDAVARDLRGAPTKGGLDLRPRLPQGATVPTPVGEVTESVYVADEVQGLAGEQGLRVTWKGTIAYPVTLAGTTSTVTYSLSTGYVFSRVPQDPGGLKLQQVVRTPSKATGVITACLAKGLLYPGAAGAACPV